MNDIKQPAQKRKRLIKINAISFSKLVAAMLEGEMTKQELSEHTGLHYITVCTYTRELHRAGAAHIARWEKDARGRDAMPIFKIGEGKDAKRARMTPAQRQAAYRARINTLHDPRYFR